MGYSGGRVNSAIKEKSEGSFCCVFKIVKALGHVLLVIHGSWYRYVQFIALINTYRSFLRFCWVSFICIINITTHILCLDRSRELINSCTTTVGTQTCHTMYAYSVKYNEHVVRSKFTDTVEHLRTEFIHNINLLTKNFKIYFWDKMSLGKCMLFV